MIDPKKSYKTVTQKFIDTLSDTKKERLKEELAEFDRNTIDACRSEAGVPTLLSRYLATLPPDLFDANSESYE